MKKIFTVLVLCCFAMCSFAQSTFDEVNDKCAFSVIGGVTGYYNEHSNPGYKEPSEVGMGLSFTIHGVYVDCFGWPGRARRYWYDDGWSYGTRTSYDTREWSITAHAGYQIPVTRNFRIIPVVGYAMAKNDRGGYWPIKKEGFDAGCVIRLASNGGFILDLAATRYNLYGGIGFEF